MPGVQNEAGDLLGNQAQEKDGRKMSDDGKLPNWNVGDIRIIRYLSNIAELHQDNDIIVVKVEEIDEIIAALQAAKELIK